LADMLLVSFSNVSGSLCRGTRRQYWRLPLSITVEPESQSVIVAGKSRIERDPRCLKHFRFAIHRLPIVGRPIIKVIRCPFLRKPGEDFSWVSILRFLPSSH